MKICAIVCEYNPFHRGHEKQIRQIRAGFSEEVCILSLMSGYFVQRGEPALLPPTERARAALAGGTDLVLELPFPFCCAPAEIFAAGAVSLLNRLGKVDFLAFGSEQNDPDALFSCAETLLSPTYEKALSETMRDKSVSFPRAAEKAFRSLSDGFFPVLPNDILAVEYLKALKQSDSPIEPLILSRENDGLTASGARASLRKGEWDSFLLPDSSAEVFRVEPTLFADLSRIESLLLGHFRLSDEKGRIGRAAENASSLSEFFALLTDKSHTAAFSRREVLASLLGFSFPCGEPLYTRLFAADERGRRALRLFSPDFPLLTKPAHASRMSEEAQKQFALGQKAAKVYALTLPENRRNESDLRNTPTIAD